jgi:Holliday junction DNA helicase RuvA
MIATLRGKVLGVNDQSLIVDVNGVGFSVMVTPTVRGQAEIGSELFLHTALLVREDAFTLFGYQTIAERETFLLLQTVSGIGPKVSHAILSSLSLNQLISAISSSDSKSLEKVSGLGKKGVQRIILELKDKVESVIGGDGSGERKLISNNPAALSVAEALAGLGFNAREIEHALEIVQASSADSVEAKLKIALTALQSGGQGNFRQQANGASRE